MAYKDYYALTADERKAHEDKWGGYNAFPPNWCKIPQKAFARSHFFTFSPVLVQYRQMTSIAFPGMLAVSTHLYFMHDNTGYAIVNDYWKGTVSFYMFGCTKPHVNNRVCEYCGFHAQYDTSD